MRVTRQLPEDLTGIPESVRVFSQALLPRISLAASASLDVADPPAQVAVIPENGLVGLIASRHGQILAGFSWSARFLRKDLVSPLIFGFSLFIVGRQTPSRAAWPDMAGFWPDSFHVGALLVLK